MFWSTSGDAFDGWVNEMCREAHVTGKDLMPPDDHRYAFIVEALDAIAETSSEIELDDLRLEADDMTNELFQWLASNLERPYLCDEAATEYGLEANVEMLARIQWGQYHEKNEVLASIRSSLQARLDKIND